jgi:biopolymer transport protein ExbD
MISGPLELQSRLSPPPRDLDVFAWVNAGLIVLFFALLGSRFVLAPGLPVGLDGDSALALPRMDGATENAVPASVVVSYLREDVILFEGGKFTLSELRKQMELYAKEHPGAVMLVRADRQVSIQDFAKLASMASQVGFSQAQLAMEQPVVEDDQP